jgi:uncharacterized membrane protein YdjX (TVP38/TMEM64 family)
MVRRAVILVIFVATLVVLAMLSRRHLSLEAMIEVEARLRTWLGTHQILGFAAGFAIYFAVSLIPGTTGKAIIAAWLYGFWVGLVLVNVGLTLAALVSFWFIRYAVRDLVASRFGPRLARVNKALEHDGPGYLFVARVLHTPFSITNYVMGATRIPSRGFWWSTQLGILPGNLIYVYAGAQAPTLEQIAEHGLSALLSPGLIAAFIAVSVLPLIIRSQVRRMMAFVRRHHDPERSRD